VCRCYFRCLLPALWRIYRRERGGWVESWNEVIIGKSIKTKIMMMRRKRMRMMMMMIIVILPLLSYGTEEIHNVAPLQAPWCHGSDSSL
jgi:hypothetical protein